MKFEFLKKYNFLNNSLGWFCFVVAAVTYLLTMEPTASFWDCPEFISQGYKLEVGHPPGNPIFMLTARFFITITGAGPESAAVVVNAMSALLSAATILLLFWTITYLTRLLIIGRKGDDALTPVKTIVIMASGLCGALMYTWSDTFWFSAVEGEVYAFSSFCTAVVFWLILKWDKRAENPSSDKYLILIAYVIGISIAVHLLNLLTIPALALVIYFRKWRNSSLKGSLLALLISFGVVAAILYGLVPGFIGIAQVFEIVCVNTFGMSYNVGVFIYAVILVAVLVWCVSSLYKQKSLWQIRVSFLLSVILSGMPFIGHSWFVPVVVIIGLVLFLFKARNLHFRLLSNIAISILVIFVGYSSYALLLIRSGANTPMNQNAPDNVFALGSYLNREQYGQNPLFYGPQFTSPVNRVVSYSKGRDMYGQDYAKLDQTIAFNELKTKYGKAVNGPDKYVELTPEKDYDYSYNVLFPRMYSSAPEHVRNYLSWIGLSSEDQLGTRVTVQPYRDKDGNVVGRYNYDGYPVYDTQMQYVFDVDGNPFESDFVGNDSLFFADVTNSSYGIASAKDLLATGYLMPEKNEVLPAPSFADNMRYFFTYQLNYMYWRYFMWNFAGRQNDIAGQGEVNRGNWISGIPFIDNARLGDQSLLPNEYGKGNKGHNVFYMLPLLMGLIGIAIQLIRGKEGVQQFWVVFFLFFMTGIAIVLYLNQTPMQPRERDYAFAGSFYAYAIWVGMGVYGLWQLIQYAFEKSNRKKGVNAANNNNVAPEQAVNTPDEASGPSRQIILASTVFVCLVALFVPIQVVSQTWDDHDRSGRYTTRDYGLNYLNSLDENAVIFTNGDNDTFPLWYAQEVLGERTDVRVVNLAYLATDWYANQMRLPSYKAAGIGMQAKPEDYAYDRMMMVSMGKDSVPTEVRIALANLYGQKGNTTELMLKTPYMYIPVDIEKAVKAGILTPEQAKYADDTIEVDLSKMVNGVTLSNLLSLDMINTSIQNGWNRPMYFAMTVPDDYYLNLGDNLKYTGLALQVTPEKTLGAAATRNYVTDTDKMYNNVVNKFRWGGLENVKNGTEIYLDETVRRMVITHRTALLNLAREFVYQGEENESGQAPDSEQEEAIFKAVYDPQERYGKAVEVLKIIEEKLPVSAVPYSIQEGLDVALVYISLAQKIEDEAQKQALLLKGANIIGDDIVRYAKYIPYLKDQIRHASNGYSAYAANMNNLPISVTDKYVPHYLMDLMNAYAQIAGYEKLNELLESVGVKDVNGFLTDVNDMDIFQNENDDNY